MNDERKRLRVASIGCGNRARVYLSLIAEQPQNFEIVAAADPIGERLAAMRELSNCEDFRSFENADDLLGQPRLADVLLIATQDNYHYDPAEKALQKGYDLILEKPMCHRFEDIVKLESTARSLGRRVIVCHVLRYTSFYQKLHSIIQSDTLGDIITMHASEGVEPWHFAHSYVRGHWAIMEESTPTIVAKCCHDMDLLHWLLGKKCTRISSFGALSFFKKANASKRQMYPMFEAARYLEPKMRVWLDQVCDDPQASNDEVFAWLAKSPWGRSVFDCDNNAVDHQVVNLEFEEGATATFTMTAFDEGRNCEIHGTRARLRAGDFCRDFTGSDIIVTEHATGDTQKIVVEDQNPHLKFGGYHNGGDVGFIKALHKLFTDPEPPITSISASVHSHAMAFGAEEARKSGSVIELREFFQDHKTMVHALD